MAPHGLYGVWEAPESSSQSSASPAAEEASESSSAVDEAKVKRRRKLDENGQPQRKRRKRPSQVGAEKHLGGAEKRLYRSYYMYMIHMVYIYNQC